MTINNRGLAGQPVLPYTDNRSYAGADIFCDLTFLDHTMTDVIPSSFQWQLDDITNDVNMVPLTTVTPSPTGTVPYTLQIPGATMHMTYPYEGSQLCQLSLVATITDTVTGNTATQIVGLAILELCAIQTPGGSF
jgi:hypothetical protein